MLDPTLLEGMFGEKLTLGEVLGEGATSVVYSAQRNTGERLVVKVFLRPFDGEEPMMRFDRECKSLSKLSHPNIIKLLQWSVRDGVPAMLFPFMEGQSLEKLIENEGPMKAERVCQLGHKLALALAHCHDLGILHRDIKPANVFISQEGEPMLIDFGLARSQLMNTIRTKTGFILGTPAFMAPEVIAGAESTIASELYSLGVLFCQLLAGRDPFPQKLPDLFAAKMKNQLPRLIDFAPHTPPPLIEVIDGLLLPANERIPKNGRALAEALASLAGEMASFDEGGISRDGEASGDEAVAVDEESATTQLLPHPETNTNTRLPKRRLPFLFTVILFAIFGLLSYSHKQTGTHRREAPEKVRESGEELFVRGMEQRGKGLLKEAYVSFKEAAKKGFRRADCEIGLALLFGRGCEKDVRKGIHHLRLAAKSKVPEAIYQLALAAYLGKTGKRDYRKIFELLKEAGEMGHCEAIFLMGIQTQNGMGTERDVNKAKEFFSKAHELGSIRAGVEFAAYSYQDNEQTIGKEKVLSAYEKGMAIGYPAAFRHLGDLYGKGKFVVKDLERCRGLHKKAMGLIKKAYEQGDPLAAYTLYTYYRYNESEKSREEAQRFLIEAADNDVPYALMRLGDAYREGNRGYPIDYDKARAYYERALFIGFQNAKVRLVLLDMTSKKR